MALQTTISVPVITVFLQGLLSFLSPCVLPLLPLYISYLSGGTCTVDEEGKEHYNRKKVFINTLCFVIGISFTFVLLGLGASALGGFFKSNQALFARIGGIIIFLFGLYQLGVFGTSKVLGKERRMPFHLDTLAMSPLTALLMGFTFSFAWTPCVGPVLTSVLVMTASAGTRANGILLIGVYTLGFVLPFLVVGFFTTSLLDLFQKHRNVVKYTVKIGGVLMLLMGVMLFTGTMNNITGYLSGAPKAVGTKNTSKTTEEKKQNKEDSTSKATKKEENGSQQEETPRELPMAPDFSLKDQYGKVHKLSDYRGKVIFLNFWQTWCPPCRAEMPDIQKLYENYEKQDNPEVQILGISSPNIGREGSTEEIASFLEKNGYTYPVLMDETGEIYSQFQIQSFPTTYMITKEGRIFGYVSGGLSDHMMKSIIDQTLSGKIKK